MRKSLISLCLLLPLLNGCGNSNKVIAYYNNVSYYFYEEDCSFDVFILSQEYDEYTHLNTNENMKKWHLTTSNCDFVTLPHIDIGVSNRFYVKANKHYILTFYVNGY